MVLGCRLHLVRYRYNMIGNDCNRACERIVATPGFQSSGAKRQPAGGDMAQAATLWNSAPAQLRLRPAKHGHESRTNGVASHCDQDLQRAGFRGSGEAFRRSYRRTAEESFYGCTLA